MLHVYSTQGSYRKVILQERFQRCKFLAYSYTTILVPTYIFLIVNDNGTYGNTRISKDIIFDESVIFDKYIDNSPTDEEFADLPHVIKNMNDVRHEKVNVRIRIRMAMSDNMFQSHHPQSYWIACQ